MLERQVADNARRFQELSERVSQLLITETSRDGMVKVTVSANGQLTDLVLKERWHPLPVGEIAAQIMDCVCRARARIPDLLRQTIHDTVGEQDPSARLLLDEALRRFPEPPPRRTAPRHTAPRHETGIGVEPKPAPVAPAPPRRAGGPNDEDDWDEREIMKT